MSIAESFFRGIQAALTSLYKKTLSIQNRTSICFIIKHTIFFFHSKQPTTMSNSEPSQQQIGRRIMQLRKAKGLSQEELAKSIGMSRPSLAQIELGNRGIDVLELRKLALVLAFSLDELLSPDYTMTNEVSLVSEPSATQYAVRVSVPELNVSKLKNVLLYMLERCAGKPNMGESVLNKLLYFCDFNYYELYEKHLTGA